MSEPLRLTQGWFGITPAIRLGGGLVFGQNLKAIHDAVTVIVPASHGDFVIELSGVDAFDSSGINALLDVRQVLGGSIDRLVLVGPSERMSTALTLIQVLSLFDVITSEAKVVGTLGPWRSAAV